MRKLYDDEGKRLGMHELPDDVALVVKAIEDNKLTFDSRLAALEVIAVAGGNLASKNEVKVDILALLLEHATDGDKVPAKGKGK